MNAAALAPRGSPPAHVSPVFDPADPDNWIARGRAAAHADALADACRRYPDLPPDAPLEQRMARTRERVAALRPLHAAIAEETERARRAANFAFVERRMAEGSDDQRYPAILRARDLHGLDWDAAVRFADGDYAARAGWNARAGDGAVGATAGLLEAAYDLGFRQAGGDPEDIFDAARRALFAPCAGPMQPAAIATSRPLPSTWPNPCDAPRPAAWSRRALILGSREADENMLGLLPLLRHQAGHDEATLILAWPGHGFTRWSGSPSVAAWDAPVALRELLSGPDLEDILIAADGEDLAFIDAHADDLPLVRNMERTRNSALQQRAQFRLWLARGRPDGETLAAGHIRWSKVAKGLSGRLGEFTAFYEGPAHPRGHRIAIRLGDGSLAQGYRTPAGVPLHPEITISNRTHLRKAMADALRRFAASLCFP